MVVLDGFEDSPAAVGITVAVEVATGGPGIFKLLAVVVAVVKQLGLHGAHFGVTLHIGHQRLQPAIGCAHIAVEQYRVGMYNLCDGTVVALGKAVVLVQRNHFHHGELVAQHRNALVGAAVVGHNHIGHIARRVRHHAGQITPQQSSTVPVQDNHSHLFHSHLRELLCFKLAKLRKIRES